MDIINNVFWSVLGVILHIVQWVYELVKNHLIYVIIALSFFFLMDALIRIRDGLNGMYRKLEEMESTLKEIYSRFPSNFTYNKLEEMESALKEVQDKVMQS